MRRLKTILNYGSLAGLSAHLMFVIYYYAFELNPLGGVKFFSLWVPVVFMYFGLKNYRDNELEGFASFGQLFSLSITFTFIYSSLSAMLVYLHSTMDAGFIELMINETLEGYGQMKDILLKVMSRDDYEGVIEETKKMDGTLVAMNDFTSKTLGTFIIALIICAVLKKQPPALETDHD